MKRLALLLLAIPAFAQAEPIKYDITFTADLGPSGIGSLVFDNDTGVLTDFSWIFDGGIVGGIQDVPLVDAFGDTFGRFLFELVSELDVHSGASCADGCGFSTGALVGNSPGDATSFRLRSLYSGPSDGGAGYEFSVISDGSLNLLAGGFLTVRPTAVPEPGSLALLAIGLAGMGLARRRRRAQ